MTARRRKNRSSSCYLCSAIWWLYN